MKKSRRTYNGVHLNKKSNTQDVVEQSLTEYWEKRFWLSEFSHLGGSRNPTGSNLVSVTEKARANPFDENELKPMNKQLKDLLA